jgi:hypothetical protein
MERIVKSGKFSPAQIRTANYCRLFLGAVTLSDLTTTTGKYLDQAKVTGRPSLLGTTMKWLTVHQESPSKSEWRVWKRANRLWSTAEGNMIQPLGPWLQSVQDSSIQCAAYGYQECIAIRSGTEYAICQKSADGYFQPTERTVTVKLVPVGVEEYGDQDWKLLKRTQVLARPHAAFPSHFPNILTLSLHGKWIYCATLNCLSTPG